MSNKKVVAWQVSNCEGYSVVVFHHHGMAAKRLGAGEFDGDIDAVEIRRAPEFDQYAKDGKIPKQAFLDAGWWFECSHCGTHVTGDNEAPVIDGEQIYCDQECKGAYESRIQARNDEFAAFKEKVTAARPYLEFTFQGGWPVFCDTARFTFDGCKTLGTVEINKQTGEPEFYINKEDEPAWLAYKAKVGVE